MGVADDAEALSVVAARRQPAAGLAAFMSRVARCSGNAGRACTHAPGAVVTHAPGAVVTHAPGAVVTHAPGAVVTHAPGAVVTHVPGAVVTHVPGAVVTHAPGAVVTHVSGAVVTAPKHVFCCWRCAHPQPTRVWAARCPPPPLPRVSQNVHLPNLPLGGLMDPCPPTTTPLPATDNSRTPSFPRLRSRSARMSRSSESTSLRFCARTRPT
eukprot:219372-Chlamydomonas_euryale.AAC.2